MFSSVLSIVAAIFIRLPALYLTISGMRYRADGGTLLVLAVFSAFLGFIMPATGFDMAGVVFRIALFVIIVMIMLRCNIVEASVIVLISAFIESFTILVFSFTPLKFLVAGMSPLTIP